MRKKILITTILLLITSEFAEARGGLGRAVRMGRALSYTSGSGYSYSPKVYGPDTLSIFQLQKCVEMEREMDEAETQLVMESDILDKKLNRNNEFKIEISKVGEYLTRNKGAEFYSQAEVDRYNRAVTNYNENAKRYNLEINELKKLESDFNDEVSIHNKKVEIFSSECGGKMYYVEDMALIKSREKNK